MIEFQNVTKVYHDTGVCALNDVSFKIRKGEFVFLIGSTGAGKTSMFRLLLREEMPDQGSVLLDGKDITKMKKRHIPKLRRGVGVVFQDFQLLSDRTVYENVYSSGRSAYCGSVCRGTGRPRWAEVSLQYSLF